MAMYVIVRPVLLFLAVFLALDYFFFQAEDGIRDADVTGAQTCALPIFLNQHDRALPPAQQHRQDYHYERDKHAQAQARESLHPYSNSSITAKQVAFIIHDSQLKPDRKSVV